ncbi:MAG: hypothetical protein LC808_31105, partial [Actinobacteria bacterium]|nr:hypothetical protein [Actinomycetota bacterium]
GSFNPLTIAHLAIAEEARERLMLDRVDLVVSRVALGKEDLARPLLHEHLREVSTRREGGDEDPLQDLALHHW